MEVGLAGSTQRMGKPCTRGSGRAKQELSKRNINNTQRLENYDNNIN